MKPIYSFLLFILLAASGNAQSNFGPVGAVWHYDMSDGVFKANIVSDTLIDDHIVSKMRFTPLIDAQSSGFGLEVWWLNPLYFYSTADTIF